MTQFSVIYSVDVPEGVSVRKYAPPRRKAWKCTESSQGEDSEYAYLEGKWAKGKHRKYCALLSKTEFFEWMHGSGLHLEDVETMGMIGAPGGDFGHLPAFSFTADAQDAILYAYVCPLPERPPPDDPIVKERMWDRWNIVLMRHFGYRLQEVIDRITAKRLRRAGKMCQKCRKLLANGAPCPVHGKIEVPQ